LKSAALKDYYSGELLSSHRDSPLFVAPYSYNADLKLTKEELRRITLAGTKSFIAFLEGKPTPQRLGGE